MPCTGSAATWKRFIWTSKAATHGWQVHVFQRGHLSQVNLESIAPSKPLSDHRSVCISKRKNSSIQSYSATLTLTQKRKEKRARLSSLSSSRLLKGWMKRGKLSNARKTKFKNFKIKISHSGKSRSRSAHLKNLRMYAQKRASWSKM